MTSSLVTPEPLPRGVAGHGRGFVSSFEGHVVALDLSSGRRLWATEQLGTPWIVGRYEVFVASPRGNNVSLSVLSTMEGTPIRSVSLPAPPVLAEAAGDFDLDLRLGDKALEVAWRVPFRYSGGAPPPEVVRTREEREASGSLRYDIIRGEVTTTDPNEPRPRLASWPYRRRGTWRETGWYAGGELVSLELDRSTLSLRRGGGESLPLAEGNGFEPVVTPCGSFLFLRRTVPPDQRWRIFSVPGAEPIGEVSWPTDAQLPTVVGERAYCLSSSILLASDLAIGKASWTYDLGSGRRAVPPSLPPDQGDPR